MVEIALSLLQGHGLPYVVAAIRGIGAYSARAAGAGLAPATANRSPASAASRSTRSTRRCCCSAFPAEAAEALQVETAVLFLLEPNRMEFVRGRRRAACCPANPWASACRSTRRPPPATCWPRVARSSSPTTAARPASRCPPRYSTPASVSALGVPLSDRGRDVGLLTVRSPRRSSSARTRSTTSLVDVEPARRHACSVQSDEQLRQPATPGERGPADRRHRARLQQPAHRHPGQPAGAGGTAGRGRGRPCPPPRRRVHARQPARRRAHRQAARVLAAPGAEPEPRRRAGRW